MLYSEVYDEDAQSHNCVVAITIWALWAPQRQLFHVAITSVRWHI